MIITCFVIPDSIGDRFPRQKSMLKTGRLFASGTTSGTILIENLGRIGDFEEKNLGEIGGLSVKNLGGIWKYFC